MVVESSSFTEMFRVSPVEPGDIIKHPNFGNGFVIAIFKDKAWIAYDNGRDRVHKIETLANSKIIRVVH